MFGHLPPLARRRDSLKPHTSTRQTHLPGASKWRERAQVDAKTGSRGTSNLLHLEREPLHDQKKVIGVRRGFSFPRSRFDAPASLPNTATSARRIPTHPYCRREALVAQKELSTIRWIRRHRREAETAAPVCPQRRPKIAPSPSPLL